MINMLVSTWMPLAITWIIVMAKDCLLARQMMSAAMSFTATGIFGLQWMGLLGFIFAAQEAAAFTSLWAGWSSIFFLIFYPLACIGMVVFHWFLSAGVYDWLKNAPLPETERNVNAICIECKLPVVIDDVEADARYNACEKKR